MKNRLLIGLAALMVSLVTVFAGVYGWLDGKWSDVALNIGSELIGIVITILVIDWLLEKQRRRDEIRRVALQALHELDHAVWVWLGGARGFDTSELLELLRTVDADDPLPTFTQNLLLVCGSKAANTLRTRSDEVASDQSFRDGLIELSKISAMRDGSTAMKPTMVAAHAIRACELLAKAAGLEAPAPAELPPERFRATTVADQEWRHYGKPPENRFSVNRTIGSRDKTNPQEAPVRRSSEERIVFDKQQNTSPAPRASGTAAEDVEDAIDDVDESSEKERRGA